MRGAMRTVTGVAATGLLILAMSDPAAAATMEYNTAVKDTSTDVGSCIATGNKAAKGCFKPYGDVVFAADSSKDGFAVYTDWQNELRDSKGKWGLYRNGRCTYSEGAYRHGACNKDMYENSSSNAWGGKGSRIRVKVCVADLGDDTCSSWSSWIYNN
ncbi:hypothetical protein ABZV81_34125 [Streptomyces parvus]|uniref:hypothetical protein n=1 Tax=Streptomyces parvus TaxID=66428 RepID=UPI0033A55C83